MKSSVARHGPPALPPRPPRRVSEPRYLHCPRTRCGCDGPVFAPALRPRARTRPAPRPGAARPPVPVLPAPATEADEHGPRCRPTRGRHNRRRHDSPGGGPLRPGGRAHRPRRRHAADRRVHNPEPLRRERDLRGRGRLPQLVAVAGTTYQVTWTETTGLGLLSTGDTIYVAGDGVPLGAGSYAFHLYWAPTGTEIATRAWVV